MKMQVLLAAAVVAVSAAIVHGEVKLAAPFMDHMVLQRGKPVAVWGTAAAGKTVTVKAGEAQASAKAGEDGAFKVMLPVGEADARPRTLVAAEEGGNTVTISDVLVGDVWILSGQSNMEWPLEKAKGGKEDAAAANDPELRLLLVERAYNDAPQKTFKGAWQACDAKSAAPFSAIGYYFAKEIRKSEGVPVGLIGTYWGGTPAEAWTPRDVLEGNGKLKGMVENFDKNREKIAESTKKWEAGNAAYEAAVKSKDAAATRAASRPASPSLAMWRQPAQLWNGMVEPLLPFTARGVLWYQGESNAGRADEYAILFPAMIEAWRGRFESKELPFHFVQLANYRKPTTRPGAPADFADVRDAQVRTLKGVPHTAMAVAIDNADPGKPEDIHPKDKATIGHRLALLARKQVYGHADVKALGPSLAKVETEGDTVTVRFDHAKGGLRAEGAIEKAFTVAGEDRKFVYATDVKVEGDTVTMKSPVGKPGSVRFSWADNPDAVLYNSEGLPASPFRTDEWELGGGKK